MVTALYQSNNKPHTTKRRRFTGGQDHTHVAFVRYLSSGVLKTYACPYLGKKTNQCALCFALSTLHDQ